MATLQRTPDSPDPCPFGLIYPQFQPYSGPPPILPVTWMATAILHPFSPPPENDPKPDTPFFQLCTADIVYGEGAYLSAQITGCSYGQWWYLILPDQTVLSTDGGNSWITVDMGWTLPTTNCYVIPGACLQRAAAPLGKEEPTSWTRIKSIFPRAAGWLKR